jgi:IS5 family transposase
MRTLIDFAIREEYSQVKALGDDLSKIGSIINWDRFRILEPLIYKNQTACGHPTLKVGVFVTLRTPDVRKDKISKCTTSA